MGTQWDSVQQYSITQQEKKGPEGNGKWPRTQTGGGGGPLPHQEKQDKVDLWGWQRAKSMQRQMQECRPKYHSHPLGLVSTMTQSFRKVLQTNPSLIPSHNSKSTSRRAISLQGYWIHNEKNANSTQVLYRFPPAQATEEIGLTKVRRFHILRVYHVGLVWWMPASSGRWQVQPEWQQTIWSPK